MKREELKAILDESKITVDDSQLDAILKHFDKVVPYDRLKEKVDEYNTLKAKYDETSANLTKLTVDKDLVVDEKNRLSTAVNELNTYKQKYELFEKEQNEKVFATHADKLKMFDITDKDSRFPKVSKIKEKLIVPEEGKQLTLEQVNRNLEVISIAEDTGLFDAPKSNDIATPAPSKTDQSVAMSPIQRFAQKASTV